MSIEHKLLEELASSIGCFLLDLDAGRGGPEGEAREALAKTLYTANDYLAEKVRPQIVCLCGSTKFKKSFEEANAEESAKGAIVLTVCWFTHADGSRGEENEQKFRELHFKKIAMADEVVVVYDGGYVGESTRKEIEYAEKLGKPIRYRAQKG